VFTLCIHYTTSTPSSGMRRDRAFPGESRIGAKASPAMRMARQADRTAGGSGTRNT
jgi:hypothetical protein